MNRLDQLATPEEVSKDITRCQVEMGRIEVGTADSLHASFVPLHYERNYRYPLIVWLHGHGGNELQLRRVMPLLSMQNYVAVGPRGTVEVDVDGQPQGYTWQQSEKHISLAEERVADAIEHAQAKYNIASERVFLAGFDDGGTMAIRLALHHPQRFAGALSFAGQFPRGLRPLRRLNEIRGLPLFLANGNENENYPSVQVCEDLRLFHAAGLCVTLRQYPCGQDLTTVMLSDMDRWIMDLVCPSSTATQDA